MAAPVHNGTRLSYNSVINTSNGTLVGVAVGEAVLVNVRWYHATVTLTSVTCGGVALTLLGTPQVGGPNDARSQWAILPEWTGSAGNQNIETTMSGSCDNGTEAWRISGHNTTTPVAVRNGASGTNTTPTVTLAAVPVDCIGFAVGSNNGADWSAPGDTWSLLTLSDLVWFDSGMQKADLGAAGDKTVSATATGASSWGINAIAIQAAPSGTLDQEGFRFGSDDGSESAHGWLQAQDTNHTAAVGSAVLLRILADVATLDPPATAYTLYASKNAGAYAVVPVGANSVPSISYGAIGALTYSAASGTSIAPSYPTGITTRSALILLVGQKPTTANGGTVTTPSGWTLVGSITGANDGDTGGYTTGLAIDTGNTNLFAYSKDTVDGSESGALTVTVGDNNVAWAAIVRLESSDDCTWSFAAATGKDTSAGSVSLATGNLDVAAGDHLIGAMVIPTDVTTPAQFSAQALAQTGTTFGTVTEIAEPDSTNGNDIGGFIVEAPVSSGSGSGAVTLTATAGGTTTNVRGPGIVLRARVASVARDLYIAPSANIVAGGEATTARLTAPSGKSTADFVTGRRWDDENGTDTIDITSLDYTEVEWSLNTQSPAAGGDTFDFRLRSGAAVFASYTVTPRLTLSGGASDISGGATLDGVSAAGEIQGGSTVAGNADLGDMSAGGTLATNPATDLSGGATLDGTTAGGGLEGPNALTGGATLDGVSASGGASGGTTLSGDAALDGPTAAGGMSSGSTGTLTSSSLKFNNGDVHSNVAFEAFISVPGTGVFVLRKTGLTSTTSGTAPVCTFADAALTPGTQYRVTWRRTDTGAEGTELLTAT